VDPVRTVAPPSGDQHVIALGDQHVTIAEVGATLRRYTVGERHVIDGFADDEMASAGRGQVLAPWPNRLEDGSYTFDGVIGSAPLDEPAANNAIHGLVRWLPWQLEDRTDRSVGLGTILRPQPAYPWWLELRLDYELTRAGLAIMCTARNASALPAPFGLGFHPYLAVATEAIDDALLAIPAERWIATDDRGLPVEERPVAESDVDFRLEAAIGSRRLDTAFTELRRNADGRCHMTLRSSDGTAVSVWMDEGFRYVQVYTGDTIEPVERRRRGIAIEPMTCPANAFRSGVDLIRLEPGATWRASWGISP
jgi:aldose 1-epimerase